MSIIGTKGACSYSSPVSGSGFGLANFTIIAVSGSIVVVSCSDGSKNKVPKPKKKAVRKRKK